MPPPGGRRREGQASGLHLRVVDLPLDVLLGELRHWVKEDQLPLPPPLPPGPGLSGRLVLDRRAGQGSRLSAEAELGQLRVSSVKLRESSRSNCRIVGAAGQTSAKLPAPTSSSSAAAFQPSALNGVFSGFFVCLLGKILPLRLTNQIVKSGTCAAGALRLLAAAGGGEGRGTGTGVRCSGGAADRLVSSCSISSASWLDPAVGCNLTWG